MLYKYSLNVHERLETVLKLIANGQYSTPALAKKIGVSIPTISRIVAALRARGHNIRASKNGNGWHYFLGQEGEGFSQDHDRKERISHP